MQNILDILFNLGMLSSLSILSGFIGNGKLGHPVKFIAFKQGVLFGIAAVIGMLNPLVLAPGLIFDGRSVMLSICALFFGPLAALISVIMPLILRITQGGPGAIMGVSVILSSAAVGLVFHYLYYGNRQLFVKSRIFDNGNAMFYIMGLIVHTLMVLLMFTLPKERAVSTIQSLGPVVIIAFPLTTVLIGKIIHSINESYRITAELRISEQNLSDSHEELESTLEEVIAQEETVRYQLEKVAISEERLRIIIENSPIGINLSDFETGVIILANHAYCEIVGKPMNQLIGSSWHEFTHPEDLVPNTELNKILVEKNLEHVEMDKRYVRADGGVIWVNVKNIVIGYGPDNAPHELTFAEDITEKKRQKDALIENERSFRSIFEATTDTILVFEKDAISDCNVAALAMFGVSTKEDLIGKTVDLISPEFQEDGLLSIEKGSYLLHKCRREGSIRFEWLHKKIDGTLFTVEVVLTQITLRGISVVHAMVRDISERKVLENSLAHLSYHDQLTGIYNRRFFEEEVNRLNVNRNYPLTFMMADVNGLKLINNSFGHQTGDELLVKVAQLLHKSCREDDIVARVGGDEFMILLPHTTSKEAEEIANRIQGLIGNETIESLPISLSLGWGTKTSDDVSYVEIMKIAEDYLYRKKLFESPSMHSKSIHTMIHTLHEKNKREESHSNRVAQLCEAIGIQMKLSDSKTKELKNLGLLHDIGKIAIDEHVLNKPGKLTEDEWREITKHPEIGYRILSTVNEMAEMAESVLAHHERYDGKGYPRGISGEAIPLHARIITVADAYDAMTCDRPYRNALTREEAMAELVKNAGTQFDPAIVAVFLELLGDGSAASF